MHTQIRQQIAHRNCGLKIAMGGGRSAVLRQGKFGNCRWEIGASEKNAGSSPIAGISGTARARQKPTAFSAIRDFKLKRQVRLRLLFGLIQPLFGVRPTGDANGRQQKYYYSRKGENSAYGHLHLEKTPSAILSFDLENITLSADAHSRQNNPIGAKSRRLGTSSSNAGRNEPGQEELSIWRVET
jgi:hypothetical protein